MSLIAFTAPARARKQVVAKPASFPAASAAFHAGVDADTLIRSVLFLAVFLSIWISFHPFQSLAEPPLALAEGGDRLNQIGFSTLFLALAAWTYFHEPGRLMLLVRPVMIAMLVWCAASIVTSWEPSLAARRLAFTLVVMSIIDADIERRTLSAIDADQNEAGLVDVAIGHRELSDVTIRDRETNIN